LRQFLTLLTLNDLGEESRKAENTDILRFECICARLRLLFCTRQLGVLDDPAVATWNVLQIQTFLPLLRFHAIALNQQFISSLSSSST
jgi:hypothetical protein